MYRAILLPHAKKDIFEASKWYNKQQKGLGKKFTNEVRKKLAFIRQNPKASNIRYNEIRTTVLDVFPFMIHYLIDHDKKVMIISAVLHTSRSPKVWKRKP